VLFLLRVEPLPPNIAGECHGRAYHCGGPRRWAEATSDGATGDGATGDRSVTSGKRPLADRIETEKSHPLPWRAVAKRAAVAAVAGISIYLVFPAITGVLASWPRLSTLDPRWFALARGVVLAYDAPLRWAGRVAQRLWNWVMRKRPLEGLNTTLLAQRNQIRTALGQQWWQALLLSAGRLAFDYLCLLAALRATRSRPRPSLILVAYAVAGIVGMIPATPGGLGLVEASLTGLLVLAQVDSSQAVLATLTYRLASYWVPLCAGPIAYGLFRLRYRGRGSPSVEGAAPA
jgi:uncharacterized membrane protein YbhN (UPF0104 family)